VLGYIGFVYKLVIDTGLQYEIKGISGERLRYTRIDLSLDSLLQNNITIGLFSALVPVVSLWFVFSTGVSIGEVVATYQSASVVEFVFASIITHGLLELFALFNLASIGLSYTVRAVRVAQIVDVQYADSGVVTRNWKVLVGLYNSPLSQSNLIYTAFLLSVLTISAVIESHLSLFVADVYLDIRY